MAVQQREAVQIFVEPRIRNRDLRVSLEQEGVIVGYPFCSVVLTSQRHLFDLGRIFDHYGYDLEVGEGFYEAIQRPEEVEV